MDWRARHRAHVEELEAEATSMLLGQLSPILASVARHLGARVVTAAAGDEAQARVSVDDLASIGVEWRAAVHNEVLPWFANIYRAGAAAAEEQVLALGSAVLAVDPELLDHAAATYLEGVQNRFYPLGDDAWAAARDELVEGFRAGESIDRLRARILDVTDLSVARAESLARTEVIAASNMGAQARIDLMGSAAPPYRQWLSTMDGRTRLTHRHADGQVAARGEPFQVGGYSLMVPGDPSGPPAEVINCRCTVLFTDTAEPLLAEGRQEGGVVDEVALAASAASLKEFRRNDVSLEAATVSYEVGPAQVDSITGEPHTGAMVALIPTAEDAERLALGQVDAVERGHEPVDALHLTLDYLGDGAEIPDEAFAAMLEEAQLIAANLPLITAKVFGAAIWNPAGEASLVLSVGDDQGNASPGLLQAHLAASNIATVAQAVAPEWERAVAHSPWVAHVCLSYDPDPAGTVREVAAAAAGPITFDRLRLTRGSEAYDFPLAGTLPEEDIDDMDRSELVAAMTEAFAAGFARARAAVTDDPVHLAVDDPAPEPVAPAEPDADAGPPAQPGEHLRAVMHRQGVPTGQRNSGRVFTNMTYRATPFAYHAEIESSAHGGQPRVVQVGLVTRVVQTDAGDYGFNRLDLDDPTPAEHARRVVNGFGRWVSIGADETLATTTLVWPAPGEGLDAAEFPELPAGEPVEEVVLQPEQVIIDGAHVAELTSVSTPAQADATLEPTAELLALYGAPAPEAADEQPVEALALAAAGYVPLQFFPGRTLSTTVGVLNPAGGCGCGGSCGGCDEAADNIGADITPALTAAAYTITLPELPPAAWFQEPTDVDVDGAFCVTDEGRVYGLLAPFGTSHRAWARSGTRMEAPRGRVDYSRFMGGWALTAEGKVHAGNVTMDCGHAAVERADHQVAREHYDNSCSVLAQVAVGESDRLGGVWMAGAITPGTRPERVARALACRCSGDWQPHPDKAGWTEFVACLMVPVPGFASAHPTTTYRGDALVASAVPVIHVPTAEVAAAEARALSVSRLAAAVGRTPAQRVLSAAARRGAR